MLTFIDTMKQQRAWDSNTEPAMLHTQQCYRLACTIAKVRETLRPELNKSSNILQSSFQRQLHTRAAVSSAHHADEALHAVTGFSTPRLKQCGTQLPCANVSVRLPARFTCMKMSALCQESRRRTHAIG